MRKIGGVIKKRKGNNEENHRHNKGREVTSREMKVPCRRGNEEMKDIKGNGRVERNKCIIREKGYRLDVSDMCMNGK